MIVTSISEEHATSSSVCTLKMGPACSTELLLLFTRLQGVTSQKIVVVSFSWFVNLGNHLNPIVCCLDEQLIRHVHKIFKCNCQLLRVCQFACMEQPGSHWTNFCENLLFEYFLKICHEN
jgi:hypothetical protein